MGATRNLLYNLVRRDLTVRYKSTVLGFFWSFIKPLALTGIFYVVFDKVLLMKLELTGDRIPLPLHMLAGMLVWTFFAGATGEAMTVILANANLIKKVRLPLLVFPVATVMAQMVHFLLALLVLIALLILAGLPPTAAYLWLIPLMALQFLLTLSVAMILSAINVFYRDVASIWEVLTTAWFYATPIIYPAYMVTDVLQRRGGWLAEWGHWLYLLNPLTPLTLGYRHVFLYASLDGPPVTEMPGLPAALGLCLLTSLVLFAAALRIFRKYSRAFADEL